MDAKGAGGGDSAHEGAARARAGRAARAALRWAVLGLIVVGTCGAPMRARAVTYLEQAERLQFINAYLLDFRPAGAPRLPPKSVFEVQLELIPKPVVDNRVGAKNEPDNAPPATPRVRAKHVSAAGPMIGLTASPPVPVMEYSAPWIGGELGWRAALGALHGELRGYVFGAQVTGPITEPGAKDKFEVLNAGADLRLGLALGRLMPYAGVGAGHTDSTLKLSDGAELDAKADYRYWLAGATYVWAPLLFTFEQERTEDFLSHFILAVAYQF